MSLVRTGGRTRRTVFSPWTVEVAVRGGALLICAGLMALVTSLGAAWRTMALLVAIAVLASLPVRRLWLRYTLMLGEAAGVALVIVLTSGPIDPLLPYLVVPPLVGGIEVGFAGVLAAAGLSAAVLGAGMYLTKTPVEPGMPATLGLWLAVGVAMGLIGVLLRYVQHRYARRRTNYAAANALLQELRDVARELPTGLDEVSLAQAALAQLRTVIDVDRAALYGRTDLATLVPLAFSGADRIDWDVDLSRGIWAQAWEGAIGVQRLGSFSRPVRGVSAVLPLRIGDRPTGLIGIERDGPAWTSRELAAAQAVADDAAMRIDSGQLFSEVRALATVEERRRLAREIHDGIAQEVAALGFLVDDLVANAHEPQLRKDLGQLRDELTRLVTELRLSIFDLRSDVQPGVGLGAALSSYVRSVGTGSGMTVHLVLDEAATRLGAEAESELLRIAQEAITNARKHAQARNLWVTCRVDPPRAFLRVADDGRGLGTARPDSYGMEIMRERAARLGATLAIRPRVGGGTVVEATIGLEAGAASAAAPAPAAAVGPTAAAGPPASTATAPNGARAVVSGLLPGSTEPAAAPFAAPVARSAPPVRPVTSVVTGGNPMPPGPQQSGLPAPALPFRPARGPATSPTVAPGRPLPAPTVTPGRPLPPSATPAGRPPAPDATAPGSDSAGDAATARRGSTPE